MKIFYCALMILSWIPPLFADDTVASIKAGSIVFEKTDGIVMTKEILSISLKKIQMHLEFVNQTKKEITTLVAFPIPNTESCEDMECGIDFNSSNPMHFTVKVNGKEKEFQLEKKLLSPRNYSLKYYWQQTFPPKKKIIIEHTYVPTAGGTSTHAWATSDEIKEYCIDPGLERTIKSKLQEVWKNRDDKKCPNWLSWSWVDYTLLTGANWKGAIGSFELIVDKEAPQNLVSLCFDGKFEKISPTEFKVLKKDYEPNQDLHLIFIEPGCVPWF